MSRINDLQSIYPLSSEMFNEIKHCLHLHMQKNYGVGNPCWADTLLARVMDFQPHQL